MNKRLENTQQTVTKSCQNEEHPLILRGFINSLLCYTLHFAG